MRGLIAVIVVAWFSLVVSAPAAAWGPEGHAIIADIAEAHLTPGAEAEARRLLALEGHGRLDEVSSWPDAYRPRHPDTGPWHYADIPLDAAAYDEGRDCHALGVKDLTCVVGKIEEFARVLGDKSQSDQNRLEALKFVIHFVGDVHQPLHAEDNHDKGGNAVHLRYFGKSTNLHAIWDGSIIEAHYGWTLGPNYSFDQGAVRTAAGALDHEITTADVRAWTSVGPATVVDWTNESHTLAHGVYDHLAAIEANADDTAYQDYAWPVVKLQLEKAGIRLAAVLNEAFQ